MGPDLLFDITIPPGGVLDFFGTITVTSPDVAGKYLANVTSNLYSPGYGVVDWPFAGPGTGPGSSVAYHQYFQNTSPGPVLKHIQFGKTANGGLVELSLTVRLESGGQSSCANHTGLVLGGSNPSEPHSRCANRQVAKPVCVKTGNFWHTFTDFAFAGRGPGLGLSRTYNSLAATTDGLFGLGWQSSADVTLIEAPSNGPVTIRQETGSESTFIPTSGGNYSASSYTDAVLTKQAGDGWTFVRGANTTMQFNTSGRLSSVKDPNNETITYGYNESDPPQLTTMTDSAGRALTFTWTGTSEDDHVDYVTDSSSPARTVNYNYNALGEMDWFTDVADSKTSFTYDGSNRMLTMRDPRNDGVGTPALVTNVYDATSGKVTSQTDRNGGITLFDYTTMPDSTIVTDPKGNQVRYGFGGGVLHFETLGYGTSKAATTSYVYDPVTLGVTKVTDPRLHVTEFLYDANFNRTSGKDALLREATATFNTRHQPLTVTAGGVTTTYKYDTSGNLQTIAIPSAGAAAVTQTCPGYLTPPADVQYTQFCYGDAAHPGDVTSMKDPRLKTTLVGYDTAGNPDSVTDPLGNERTTEYSTAGLPLRVVLPRGNVAGGTPADHDWVVTRNARGQVLTATDPLNHAETRGYDANGNLDWAQDKNLKTTSFVYDDEDQLTEVHRPDSVNGVPVVEKTEYWPDGSLWKQIDGATKATTYEYDPLGRLESVIDPDNRKTTFVYDLAGNQIESWDATNRKTTNAYDVANQLTAVTYADTNTPAISLITYDAAGRRETVTQSDGVNSSWDYDSLGRLTDSNDSTGSVGYEYDLANNLTKVTYPGNKLVTRGYDDAGRMTSSLDWLGNTTTFGYNEDSALTFTDQPGGQRDNYGPEVANVVTLDAANRMMGSDFFSNYATGTKNASLGYSRDNADNLSGFTQTGLPGAPSQSFGYSAANMLTTLNGSSTWAYDLADNLTKTSQGKTQSFTAGNALCGAASLASSTCATPTGDTTKYTVDGVLAGVPDISKGVGTRTSMTPQVGNVVNYGWSQTQRLTSVTPGAYHSSTPAGWSHTMTVRADGTVEAFGSNTYGQLGNNSTTDSRTPTDVRDTTGAANTRLANVRTVATGGFHSAAIDNNGALHMWGLNNYGQLGYSTGADTKSLKPKSVVIPNGFTVAAVAPGASHTLALTADGAVYSWGDNGLGQLGYAGGQVNSPTPVPSLASGVVAIAARGGSSYALKANGTVWAWGHNAAYQLGSTSPASTSTPQQVPGITTATAISAGDYSAYALLVDKTVKAWGLNTLSQLGNAGAGSQSAAPVDVSGATNVAKLVAGGFHGIVLKTDGTVWTWGMNSEGQLGLGASGTPQATAQRVTGLDGKGIESIDAGRLTSLAVATDGTAYTFGDNTSGQLGNGSITDNPTPSSPADGYGPGGASAPGGLSHTLEIRQDGTVSAAGLNTNGQLGDGTTTQRTKAVAVKDLRNVTAVATGQNHSVARDADGNVWTWGQNTNGQLGDVTNTDRRLATRLYNISGVTAIAATGNTTYALKSDGTVWAWGKGNSGQLGNAANVDSNLPVLVQGVTGTVTAIAGGGAAGYALTSDGKVWAWGQGGFGQLGDTTWTDRNTAASVSLGASVATQISAGTYYAMARISDGTIKGWGKNDLGQLGNGNTTNTATPGFVKANPTTNLTGVTKVVAGGAHALALVTGGTVKSWGSNAFGQLGINNTSPTSTPTPRDDVVMPSGITFSSVDAGGLNSTAISTGGDLYTWGYNANGQLGDGTTSQKNKPTLVIGALDLDNIAIATTYKYAADGLRTSKTTGGTATNFVWDRTTGAAGLLTETKGNFTTSYLYGPDGVAYAQIDPAGTVTYLHHDQIGSIRLATNTAGAVTGSASYDAYGTLAGQTGVMPTLGWTGEYRDTETGFTYLRARYYDPTTGQFLSRDPMAASTREAYGYVGGDPLNTTDPTGQNPLIGALIGGGIDLGIQLLGQWASGCGVSLGDVNWASVGRSALLGAALDVGAGFASSRVVLSERGAITLGGASKATRSLDDLSAAGAQLDRNGLTQAGRALQKHAYRAGNSAYPKVPGTQLNSAGQGLLDDILTNPLTAERSYVHPTFGPVREFLLPNIGARFGEFGRLIGFL